MSFQEYVEEKCKNCTKDCKNEIVHRIDGTIECIEE